MAPTHDERQAWAIAAMKAYCEARNEIPSPDDYGDAIVDLITDLLHHIADLEDSPADAAMTALAHYQFEQRQSQGFIPTLEHVFGKGRVIAIDENTRFE